MTAHPLDSLTLKPANEAQTRVSRELSCLEWHRGRSVKTYLDEYAAQDKCPFAAGGKLVTWVLVPRDQPETETILAACETYRRKLLVKRVEDAEPEDAVGYGIASVFVRPEFRKRGYASHMMRLLHHVLARPELLPPFPARWGAPPPKGAVAGDGLLSVLYSDVGDFYGHCGPGPDSDGWIPGEERSAVWRLQDHPEIERVGSVNLLNEQELTPVLGRDDAMIQDELTSSNRQGPVFSFLPGDSLMDFLVKRFTFANCPKPDGVSQWPPTTFGAAVDSSETKLAFAAWSFEMRPIPSTLTVGRVRANKESWPLLLSAALRVAQEAGVEQVEVWNLPQDLESLTAELGGRSFERAEHLPCFAWYGGGGTPVEWANNERFSWC